MSIRTRLVAGGFAAAAVAAPLFAALTVAAPQASAQPACLATVQQQGSLPQCVSYSNGQPVWVGTPIYNGGNSPNSGISTGPLFPGTTINQGIG
jgi:hypothetical protein